jgi:hypothetical protein
MAAYLSTDLAGSANQTTTPVGYKPAATVVQSRLKRLRGLFTYNTQTTSDTLVIGNLPSGATFAFGAITTSASTSTATLAVGISGATGKYKAAGAVTTTDTPQLFGLAAEVGGAPTTAETQVFVTIGTASLPASGTLVVDIFYSLPN